MTYSRTSTARTATTGSSLPSVTAEQDARTGSTESPATCSGTPTRPIRAKTTSATSSLHLHFKFSSVSLQNVEVKITRKKFHGNLLLYFFYNRNNKRFLQIFFVATKVIAMGNSFKKMSTIWTKIKTPLSTRLPCLTTSFISCCLFDILCHNTNTKKAK